MNAGMPGLGLGGLFTILAALLSAVLEVGRAVTGRGCRRRWRSAIRHALVAAAMVVVGVASWWGLANAVGLSTVRVFGMSPAVLPFALLAAVLIGAKASVLFTRSEPRREPSFETGSGS